MQRGGNERSGPWKKSRSQHEGMLKLWHMPKSPDPSSTFPRIQMLSQFLIVHLRCSYVTCQVQYVSFSLCIFFSPLLMLFSRLSLTGLPPTPSTVLPQPPPSICPCPSTACVSFLFLFWLFFICWLLFPSITCSSYTIPSCCAVSPCFIDTTCSTLHQPPSWPLPAASMPWSPHPFVYGSMWVFFIIILLLLTPASLSLCATSLPSCCVCSLVPCPLPHATSTLSCHVHSLVLCLHPHLCCINPPSPGLSRLHRHPDLCAPCQMPLNAPPLHTVFCICCAPTPSYALASPYVCVCACSCAIVHLLLYMY